MREFDTTFIVQPEISEEGREALILKLRGVLERSGAVPLEVDDMGKKKLAFEIKKFQKGHYLSLFYLDKGQSVAELERAMRIDESVLRWLTVRREDSVADIEARKARAVDLERLRKEKAAERAVREAEERAQREAARLAGESVDDTSSDDEEDEDDYQRPALDDSDDDDDKSPAGE
ncbi:MAG: 30S ribosomal protein S6 [Methylococcaceae bacterium]|nr:30S ribosomal protein S6 [Methylococcaceae bacterium]